jgi:hypothetical protein
MFAIIMMIAEVFAIIMMITEVFASIMAAVLTSTQKASTRAYRYDEETTVMEEEELHLSANQSVIQQVVRSSRWKECVECLLREGKKNILGSKHCCRYC